MANPTLLTSPIAENGDKNVIPATTGATTGLLDQEHGFQQINELPLQAGGLPPQRKDFNGVFNLLSKILFYTQKGWQFEFDELQDYYAGCIVKDTDGQLYEALNDVSASSTHPKDDTINWVVATSQYGFRLPNKTYSEGDVAHHPSLPTNWILTCTTAGTTSASALTIGSVSLGDTITDGSVTWTVRINLKVHDYLYSGGGSYVKTDYCLLQWGSIGGITSGSTKEVTFPISFAYTPDIFVMPWGTTAGYPTVLKVSGENHKITFTIKAQSANITDGCYWFAIARG